MEESEAVRKLQQGDIGGLETLVRLHQQKALSVAYLVVRDARLAEDVTADAFLRAYGQIKRFDPQRPFGPWFLRLVINIAKRTAVRSQRTTSLVDSAKGVEFNLEEIFGDRNPGLEELAEQADRAAALWSALGRLTPEQRAAVVQHYYLEMSEVDISNQTSQPLGTIKWRLHAARQRLRTMLEDWWRSGIL